jgi:hypothetical protein
MAINEPISVTIGCTSLKVITEKEADPRLRRDVTAPMNEL